MTGELLEEFEDWLSDRAAADVDTIVNHAETFLDWRTGSPVDSLGDGDIRVFLLQWCPRQLSMPAEKSAEMCAAVGELLIFLSATGRLRGGSDRGGTLATLAISLAGPMQAAMADPANYGMAKSLFAGIDGAHEMTEEELRTAMQRRVEEHNAMPIEQRRALTDRFFDQGPQSVELPFLYVAPQSSEVAAAAAKAALSAKVRALHDYLGEKGVALTAKGNLKLADGRALVEILDTDDEFDPKFGDSTFKTHTTAQLRQLMYLLAVFEESRAVRSVGNRLVPIKSWARKPPVDQASRLFRTVVEYGVLSMMGPRMTFYDQVHALLDDGVVHWLAGLLAPGARADAQDILELNESVLRSQFDSEEIDYYASNGHLAEDLSRILDVLDMTGVIEWAERVETHDRWGHRYWTGGTVALTAFGRHVLPDYLPAAGLSLRTAPDLAEASLTDLLSALDSIPAEQHSSIVADWRPTLPVPQRAGLVAALAAEATDARTRLAGMRLLGMFDPEVAERHIRQLLDTPAAGHAAIWLLDHGLGDPDVLGAFITPAVLIDILSQLLDHPDLLCEQFLAGQDPQGFLEFFWRHPAPETAAVLDTLGRHLPDRALSKQARKAAIKHRSWMANGGR